MLLKHLIKHLRLLFRFMDGTFQVTAGFQDSNIFKKAMKMALSLRCILNVNSHLSGFKL